jgi:hypothetical protein
MTRTSTFPADSAGDLAFSFVADTNVTAVAATVPNSTVDDDLNLLPVIVTTVDPVLGPDVGAIFVTFGLAAVFATATT